MQRIYLEHTPAGSDGVPGGHLYLVRRDTSDPAFDINDPVFFSQGEVIRGGSRGSETGRLLTQTGIPLEGSEDEYDLADPTDTSQKRGSLDITSYIPGSTDAA